MIAGIRAIRRRREQGEPPAAELDRIERILHRVVPPGDLARNHPGGVLEGLADAAPTRQARQAFDRWYRAGQTALTSLDQALSG